MISTTGSFVHNILSTILEYEGRFELNLEGYLLI